jgi:hypothetical protein
MLSFIKIYEGMQFFWPTNMALDLQELLKIYVASPSAIQSKPTFTQKVGSFIAGQNLF